MTEIDWKQYEGLCSEMAAPAVERFTDTLRKATVVATEQSIPVYSGAMRGSLVTVLRQMIDILKKLSEARLESSQLEKIRWKHVEDGMRETYFLRLADIKDMYVAREYAACRIQGKTAEKGQMYQWVYSLHGKEKEIERIGRQILEQTRAFAGEDVPKILEAELLGLRRAR